MKLHNHTPMAVEKIFTHIAWLLPGNQTLSEQAQSTMKIAYPSFIAHHLSKMDLHAQKNVPSKGL